MSTGTQSHISEHHNRHWDFAKLLTTLSTAFLTIVTASGGLTEGNWWLVTGVFVGQLVSLFCGVVLLYQMIREPAIHQQAAERKIDEKEAKRQIDTNGRWCLGLHIAQIGFFAASLIALVVVLVCYVIPSDTQPKETVVECRLDQDRSASTC